MYVCERVYIYSLLTVSLCIYISTKYTHTHTHTHTHRTHAGQRESKTPQEAQQKAHLLQQEPPLLLPHTRAALLGLAVVLTPAFLFHASTCNTCNTTRDAGTRYFSTCS